MDNLDQSLWCAVITQALNDAVYRGNDREGSYNRDQARAWFNIEDSEFVKVCAYAGVDPGQVEAFAFKYIAESEAKPKPKMQLGLPREQRLDRGGRRSPIIEHRGTAKTAVEWSDDLGIPSRTIVARFRSGMPTDRVLSLKRLPRGREAGAVPRGRAAA